MNIIECRCYGKKRLMNMDAFDTLADTVVREKAAEYFSSIEGKKLPSFRVNNKARSLLREFHIGRRRRYSRSSEKAK